MRRACEACRAIKQRCEGGDPCTWCIQQSFTCKRLERRSWGSSKAKAVTLVKVEQSTLIERPKEMPSDELIEACAMAACFHFDSLGSMDYYFMDGSALVAMAVIAQELSHISDEAKPEAYGEAGVEISGEVKSEK